MSFGTAPSLNEQLADNPQAAINAASWESAIAIPKVRGVLIDVTANTVTDIEFEPTLQEFYRLINCGTIEAVRTIVPDHTLYVDEEGLFKPIAKWFTLNGQPFNGNGLILGPPDCEGNETSASITADEIRNEIRIFQVRSRDEDSK